MDAQVVIIAKLSQDTHASHKMTQQMALSALRFVAAVLTTTHQMLNLIIVTMETEEAVMVALEIALLKQDSNVMIQQLLVLMFVQKFVETD